MIEEKHITLTYLNIRQSISILIAKLIFTDLLMAVLVIGAYFLLITGSSLINYNEANTPLFLTIFIGTGIFKVFTSTYVILLWLNEYYEITPEYIIHKKGIIFRKVEQYKIDNIREIDVQDSFLGEILNYATIVVKDIRLNKYLDMNYIHNARRYAKVLQQLKPNLEMKQDHTNLPFLPKEESIEDDS